MLEWYAFSDQNAYLAGIKKPKIKIFSFVFRSVLYNRTSHREVNGFVSKRTS